MTTYTITLLTQNFWTKAMFSIFAFLIPLLPFFYLIFIIVGLDLITGIWKSLKKGHRIKSSGTYKTVQKIGAYGVVLITISMFEIYALGLTTLYVTQYSMGFILLNEVYSILENVSEITGNKSILGVKDIITNVFNKNKQ